MKTKKVNMVYPVELLEQIDEKTKTGYTNRTQFVMEAIRFYIKELNSRKEYNGNDKNE